MDRKDRKPVASFKAAFATMALFACAAILSAQNVAERPRASESGTGTDFELRLGQLTSKLDSMRQQLKESQSEMEQLRTELGALRAQLAEKDQSDDATRIADSLRTSVEEIKDSTEVLQAEVKQHDQTKVESSSKLPIRISGVLLFTSVLNSGNTDNIDVPVIAIPTPPNTAAGSLSATARQTMVGIDATGPSLWGAKTSADISVDFFGGVPYSDYTTASGSVRLRTAHAGLDWPHRSLSFAFDRPLISPSEPTSWMTLGEPALAWSGNLWTWSPQIKFKETSILPNHRLSLEFGLIDPAAPGSPAQSGFRVPNASERSHQPGYEARLGHTLSLGDHQFDIGAGGYYSRHTYPYDRHLDAWAGTADWNVSILRSLAFSGEVYRGRGIGGLGGGAFKDYVINTEDNSLVAVNAAGGWGQLKFKISPSLEVNLAAGQDDAFAGDLRYADLAANASSYTSLARNQSAFGNLVFRPKSYLLFSTELRELRSWPITGQVNQEHIFGVAAGYLF